MQKPIYSAFVTGLLMTGLSWHVLAQNVGVATPDPQAPFHVASSGQVNTPGGLMLLGDTSEAHLEMDFDILQAKFGNGPHSLRLQPQGGDLRVGLNLINADALNGFVGIGINTPTTELHVSGEMQMATEGLATSQKDKIAIRGILEDATMLGLGWLRNSSGIGTIQESGIGNRSMVDIYEIYYKSQGSHRWFINQIADFDTPRMILNPDGWLGIGPNDPDSKLHITGGLGASLTGEGYLQIGNTTGTNLVFDTNELLARSNGNPSTLFFQFWGGDLSLCSSDAGQVGIGNSSPQAKLHITDGGDVTLAAGGELVLGATSGANLGMDGNEIQARSNGAASHLFLQVSGGDVLMVPNETGQVGIGVTSSANMPDNQYLLAVDGKIISEEVRVELSGTWPDYVFNEDYILTPLNELEYQIEVLGHLPGIPSASTIEQEGFELGHMQGRVMEKIEELTLYMIVANKEIEALKKANASLEARLVQLQN